MVKRIVSAMHSIHVEHRVEACFHVAYYSAAVLDFEHVHHYAEIGIIIMTVMALVRRD